MCQAVVISEGKRLHDFLALSTETQARAGSRLAPHLLQETLPPPALLSKFEQEQHYHSFTTWEGEADLQPPINLGWCKIINPHLLVWFEQDIF